MGMVSGWLDNLAERQFAKDESGRLVFLPRGPRRPGVYVGAPDESKFKSLVKVYSVAAALINLAGSTASIAFTQALAFDDRGVPLARKLESGLIVYAISALLLYIGPGLLLWSIYRGEVKALSSSLTAVDPASVHLTSEHSGASRKALIVLVAGLLVLAVGIWAAVSFRR